MGRNGVHTTHYWAMLPGLSALLLAPAAQASPEAAGTPSPLPPSPPTAATLASDAVAPGGAIAPIEIHPTPMETQIVATAAIAPIEIHPPPIETQEIPTAHALGAPLSIAAPWDEADSPAPQASPLPQQAQAMPRSRVLEPTHPVEVTAAIDPTKTMTQADWLALVNEPDEFPSVDEQTPERSPQASRPQVSLPQPPAPQTPIAQSTPSQVSPDSMDWMSGAMAQVTSVAQLEDVQPTDWAYQALQSLVERYGVVAGYPDGTFRGDRPLTRYEFAAGLNAAVDALTLQLAIATDGGLATQDDLAVLRRLQEEFGAELATLRGRVDVLEARVDQLEAQQVSPLLRLNGEVILGLSGADGGDPPGTGEANVVLTHLTQLQFSGSITGRDVFRIGLSAGNFNGLGFANPDSLNTRMALLGFQDDTNNTVELSSLEYRFAVGDRLVVTLKPVGFSLTTVLSPNSLFSSASEGALSRFAAFNPVFRIGALDSGVGVDWLMSDRARLQVAYGARNGGDGGQGFFAADQRALGVQLLTRPLDTVTTGIAYINGFDANGFLNTFTGSNNADTSGGFNEPSTLHAVSGTLQWQVTPTLVFGAWGGIIGTDSLPTDAAALSTTYQFSLGFIDPFSREGDLLGLIVGQPPRLRIGNLIEREDEGSSLHYEAFYRFRVNDHLDITPGLFVVTNPGHIGANNTIVVGSIRSTFRF